MAAGDGTPGYTGDGGPAINAGFYSPEAVAVDRHNNLFIVDYGHCVVRRVDAVTGLISTVAGNGILGFSGDGGPATSASLGEPFGLAIDSVGNLFIADGGNQRIRRLDAATGILITVAGNGASTFSGDGGPATSATLYIPQGAAIDASDHLFIADTYNNRVRKVSLTPSATLSTTSLSFNDQLVGTRSWGSIVTLSNTGGANLVINNIRASGNYDQTSDCPLPPATLHPGSACVITVTFAPTAAGTQVGTLTLEDTAVDSPQTVSLSGKGTKPVVNLTTPSLSFGPQLIGTTSAVQVVTLSNVGTAPLTINSILTSGDFAQAAYCTSTLEVGASCSIDVTFTPTATGTRTGAVTITDNDEAVPGSAQVVTLTGTGVLPIASLSGTTLNFGNQNVGTTSPAQTIALENIGSGALTISGIAVNGDFAQSNNCAGSLAASATCAINVTFTPTAAGTRSGIVTIRDNSTGIPGSQTITLTGTGTQPAVSLSQSTVTVAPQIIGTTSTPVPVALMNSGNAVLAITSITATGDFAESNTCGSTLAAQANCLINITFPAHRGGDAFGHADDH